MMGRLKSDQGQLFYEFHLGDAVRAVATGTQEDRLQQSSFSTKHSPTSPTRLRCAKGDNRVGLTYRVGGRPQNSFRE
jgi:hypothetical protein